MPNVVRKDWDGKWINRFFWIILSFLVKKIFLVIRIFRSFGIETINPVINNILKKIFARFSIYIKPLKNLYTNIMQQLEEGIKKDLIKHPFRNIEIIYEAGKTTLTAQDEELLAAYISLHDFELEMKNTASALFQEAPPINRAVEALHEELKGVKATFDTCGALADKLSDDSYKIGRAHV